MLTSGYQTLSLTNKSLISMGGRAMGPHEAPGSGAPCSRGARMLPWEVETIAVAPEELFQGQTSTGTFPSSSRKLAWESLFHFKPWEGAGARRPVWLACPGLTQLGDESAGKQDRLSQTALTANVTMATISSEILCKWMNMWSFVLKDLYYQGKKRS